MKYRLGTVFSWIMCLGLGLQAQPVLDGPRNPEPGDTLFYFTDDLPRMIDVTQSGPNQYWNFASLKAPFIEFKQVQAAASSKLRSVFPEADLMIVDQNGNKEYYESDQNGMHLLGGNSLDISLGSIQNFWSFDKSLPLDGINLDYEDEIDFQSVLTSKMSMNKVSSDLQQALESEVDSILVKSAISRTILADAWGRVQIPGGVYDVIRYRISDLIEYDIKTMSGSSDWVDADKPNTGEFATRNLISFHYISPDYPQPVASIYMKPNGNPGYVRYLADSYQARSYKTATPGQWLYAYPNPALSVVRFKLFDIRPGRYYIRFYNILGKLLFEEKYDMAGDETIELNIGQLQRGTYLYSLVDDNGNKLVTKRLIVIKP